MRKTSNTVFGLDWSSGSVCRTQPVQLTAAPLKQGLLVHRICNNNIEQHGSLERPLQPFSDGPGRQNLALLWSEYAEVQAIPNLPVEGASLARQAICCAPLKRKKARSSRLPPLRAATAVPLIAQQDNKNHRALARAEMPCQRLGAAALDEQAVTSCLAY